MANMGLHALWQGQYGSKCGFAKQYVWHHITSHHSKYISPYSQYQLESQPQTSYVIEKKISRLIHKAPVLMRPRPFQLPRVITYESVQLALFVIADTQRSWTTSTRNGPSVANNAKGATDPGVECLSSINTFDSFCQLLTIFGPVGECTFSLPKAPPLYQKILLLLFADYCIACLVWMAPDITWRNPRVGNSCFEFGWRAA